MRARCFGAKCEILLHFVGFGKPFQREIEENKSGLSLFL